MRAASVLPGGRPANTSDVPAIGRRPIAARLKVPLAVPLLDTRHLISPCAGRQAKRRLPSDASLLVAVQPGLVPVPAVRRLFVLLLPSGKLTVAASLLRPRRLLVQRPSSRP